MCCLHDFYRIEILIRNPFVITFNIKHLKNITSLLMFLLKGEFVDG